MSLEIAVNGCYVHVIDEPNDRHTGDLGNIEEASDGTIVTSLTDNYISLEVQSPYSIVGRAVVVSVQCYSCLCSDGYYMQHYYSCFILSLIKPVK